MMERKTVVLIKKHLLLKKIDFDPTLKKKDLCNILWKYYHHKKSKFVKEQDKVKKQEKLKEKEKLKKKEKVKEQEKVKQQEKIEKVMRGLDLDGNGSISRYEFQRLLESSEACRALNEIGVGTSLLVHSMSLVFNYLTNAAKSVVTSGSCLPWVFGGRSTGARLHPRARERDPAPCL